MGIIIKKRFRPCNFVQYLHLNDVYSVGPKPRKEQQVYIKNPRDYIIPQSTVNSALYNAQQAENVEKAGANKTFAKYYGGTGDNRSFVWTAKPLPPVAMSLDSLGEDFDRNYGINQARMAEVVRQDRLKQGLAQFHKKYPIPAHAMRYKKNFQRALLRARDRIDAKEFAKRHEDYKKRVIKDPRKYGGFAVADQFRDMYGKKTFFGIMRDEVKLRKYNVQKYGPLSLQALEEAAARSRLRKIANSVFEERHQEMMLVKDAENAQGSDPAPFFPTAGTNVDAKAQQKLSKEAQKLIKEKGPSPNPQGRKPVAVGAKSTESGAKKKLGMGQKPVESKDLKHISPEKLKPPPPDV